jgi:cytochrome bd ubiquinol oxidase subunit I
MDVEILSRAQFALTIMFHYIYPILSIGLGVMIVIMEGFYLWSRKQIYLDMAKFWTRIFALTFALGVATGIVMEFEFGTNWAAYSRYVGDVFGSALAAEGVFAFFLESGFLALLLFGWDRIGPKLHFFSACMVALGAHFSAVWIVVANSWMQTPTGYHVVGEGMSARAEITDFWAMVFNPSSVDRLIHVLIGCWLAGSFLVISVSAWYLLKNRHIDFAKRCMKIGLSVAFIAVFAQLISGDSSGRVMAEHQKPKMAALEGVFETQKDAPMVLAGIPNTEENRVDYAIQIPGLLSFLAYRDFDATVMGLDALPPQDRPNVNVVFQTYRLMIYMWGIMFLLSVLGVYFWWRGTLFKKRWLLRLFVPAILCPIIANEMGWVSAEMGRYPWIVYELLRISEGLSRSVTAEQVLGSIIMFGAIYLLLFILFIYLLDHKIRTGPHVKDEEQTHHHSMEVYVEELKHGKQ